MNKNFWSGPEARYPLIWVRTASGHTPSNLPSNMMVPEVNIGIGIGFSAAADFWTLGGTPIQYNGGGRFGEVGGLLGSGPGPKAPCAYPGPTHLLG